MSNEREKSEPRLIGEIIRELIANGEILPTLNNKKAC